jgi:ubiquinone/menaquinone biosynthesis C-methylase UbiE
MNTGTRSITDNSRAEMDRKAQQYTPINNIQQQEFERLYHALRTKENRIYSDEELTELPNINRLHPYYKEWLLRKASFRKLKACLSKKKKSLDILEPGCGNGWLANRLSSQLNCRVTGVDINRYELEQAARVFQLNTECTFLYGDIRSGMMQRQQFDIVLFAASIQYFPSLKEIVDAAFSLLRPGGEIHIIDSHFYNDLEIEEARQRSKSYFTALGFPGMSAMYFHHSFKEICQFQPSILHNPNSITNLFSRYKVPFYWLCIRKD